MSAGTEVELRAQPTLPMKVSYARELANSGLLPAAYRRNPANVLYAIEYGDMLGLSPMAAITGVHVIEGKPSASAGLISALVRRAGHKLRVRGDSRSATCTIIRADDPDYAFEVTWTLKRNADGNPSAEEAGLLGKQVWKQYGASMLKARAITQCARDACEEALFGLHYTPEELGAEVDGEGVVLGVVVPDDEDARDMRPAPEPVPEPAAALAARDEAWLDAALAKASGGELGKDGCLALWKETAGKVHAGEIGKPDAARIQGYLRARLADIAAEEQARAAALEDDDPWAVKIEALISRDEAEGALAEVAGLLDAGHIDQARAGRLSAAIEARFPAQAVAA